jgi:hypothetical protein
MNIEDLIAMVFALYILWFALALSMLAVVLAWNVLKLVMKLAK